MEAGLYLRAVPCLLGKKKQLKCNISVINEETEYAINEERDQLQK